MPEKRLKIIQFVAGGFTGSTAIAIDLVNATKDTPDIDSILVLRKRPSTDSARVEKLKQSGTPLTLISGGLKLYSVFQLYRLCKRHQPDILVTHGFTEHLWGRYAGLLARVPTLIHVEHNSRENYSHWRLWQTRFLSHFTQAIVGCAEGVKVRLQSLGMPPEKLTVIANGIDLSRFENIADTPFSERTPGIVMSARFGKQKDHLTAIRALGLLKQQGIIIPMLFAGTGNKRYIEQAQALSESLGLSQQITFAGHCDDLPALLTRYQFFLLSSHYEGMPLALAEGMAAGCCALGSRVPGIQEMLHHDEDGMLVDHASPEDLANTLRNLLNNPNRAKELAHKGRERALREFSLERMRTEYEMLYRKLASNKPTSFNLH